MEDIEAPRGLPHVIVGIGTDAAVNGNSHFDVGVKRVIEGIRSDFRTLFRNQNMRKRLSGYFSRFQMPRDLKNLIGPQIARNRGAHTMSQEQFAAHCQRQGWDISRETLAKIESGHRCVTDLELADIAKALEITVQDLFPANKRYLFQNRKK